MRVRLTATSLEWLADHHVFLQPDGAERLRPGDDLEFRDECQIEPYVGVFAGNSVCALGFQSYSNSALPPKLTVGRYCSIAIGVTSHLAGHPLEFISTSPFTHDPEVILVREVLRAEGDGGYSPVRFKGRRAPVIEHDVWIGAHAVILPGVTIATGAVVAAASVVTRDVGPYEIVGGNPARLIRRRFSDGLVATLLGSQWWRYRFTDFAGLPFDDPGRFAEAFLKRKEGLEPYAPPPIRLRDIPRD